MKVFISIPRDGRSIREIRENLSAASNAVMKIFSCEDKLEVIDNVVRTASCVQSSKLFDLGHAITDIGSCDAVYFCPGWEESKECLVIHKACELFDIQRIEV